MSHKRKGQLTVSDEWARHLRPAHRRAFWKQERRAETAMIRDEVQGLGAPGTDATGGQPAEGTPDQGVAARSNAACPDVLEPSPGGEV